MFVTIVRRKRNFIKPAGEYRFQHKQNGIALPLTLILLFVMTLIAIATLRNTTLEENMSANSRLRQIAFNAGESALAEAERLVRGLEGQRRRDLFFGNGLVSPDPGVTNLGDTCTNGFCTPAKYTSPASAAANGERWEDPGLAVWETAGRHIEYSNFLASGLANEGVVTPPRYIIEFLGNYDSKDIDPSFSSDPTVRPKFSGRYEGNCRDQTSGGNELVSPNDVWPFCASDPGVFRITVRATAGPTSRQAVVFLQSTLQVAF